jgi:sigma-B regulation protein RsbU (phosphoserine phosphatase)
LGIEENLDYLSDTVYLKPGSSLLLYTDGIPEAVNINNHEFSKERLNNYFRECTPLSSKNIIEGLINTVRHFTASDLQSDDITSLVIKLNH